MTPNHKWSQQLDMLSLPRESVRKFHIFLIRHCHMSDFPLGEMNSASGWFDFLDVRPWIKPALISIKSLCWRWSLLHPKAPNGRSSAIIWAWLNTGGSHLSTSGFATQLCGFGKVTFTLWAPTFPSGNWGRVRLDYIQDSFRYEKPCCCNRNLRRESRLWPLAIYLLLPAVP